MVVQNVSAKIGNMRKPQSFVVYAGDSDVLTVQSDDCIGRLTVATRELKWTRNKGGAQFMHLSIGGNNGKGVETLSPELTQQFVDAQAKKGQSIGFAGSGITIG